MAKPEEYGVSVRLVQEDGSELYEARVLELPDVRVYGENYSEAYTSALEIIKSTQEIFAQKGKPFPEVQAQNEEFSGRVTLRMSKSLHGAIHCRAQADGVSLNQWIVEAIAARIDGSLVSAKGIFFASQTFKANIPAVQIQHAQHIVSLGGEAHIFGVPNTANAWSVAAAQGKYVYSPSLASGEFNLLKGIGYE